MEGWMGLFVDEPRTLLDEAANATVVAVEPARVRSRLEELLGEERELTDVVAATWRASEEVPLLHLGYDAGARTVESTSPSRRTSLPPRRCSPRRPSCRATPHVSPRTCAGGRRTRSGVILTSTPAAIERMADQLRGEGLDVTTDPAHVLEARLSVLESAAAEWLLPRRARDRRLERERSHRSAQSASSCAHAHAKRRWIL